MQRRGLLFMISAWMIMLPFQSNANELSFAELMALAENGNLAAAVNVGVYYAHGKDGIPRNFSEAFKWWHMAAERGNPVGQMDVGELYESGRGVELDFVEAYKWFSLAILLGENRAQILLDRLTPHMTQGQIMEAQMRAAKWRPILK